MDNSATAPSRAGNAPARSAPIRILATKYAPPCSDSHHLQRQHLLDQMENARDARLILVRAAAGFGKTTLLQQFHDRCRATGRRPLWINLDAADNDLQRFVVLLWHGLRNLLPEGAEASAADEPGTQNVLDLLGQCQPPFAILFDEFEVIQNPSVLSFVQQILDSLPTGGVLAIGTRTTPELDLGRLAARGRLLELAPGAMRFSLEETTSLVRDKRQLPLLNNLISSLYRRTEGWVTAIYLACLSLQGREDHASVIASFSGSNLQLAEYLAEDILARLDDDCRQFLLQTSVVEQFCAPLCDALTGRDDSQAMLQRLERANLFLIPIEGQHQWFRYHSLFTSFLRDALERRHPGQARELQRKAAQWFLAEGRPIPAIELLLDAGDQTEAAGQLAEHIDSLVETGRTRMLLRWLDRLPGELLDRHPRLNLAYAWALIFARRFHDANRLIDQLSQTGEAMEAQTLRCLLLGLTDEVEECCRVGLEQLLRLPEGELFQYDVLINALAYNLIASGRYDEARQLIAQARERDAQSPSSLLRSVSDCNESILDLIQGRLGEGLARLQGDGANPWHEVDGKSVGALLTRDAISAQLLYEIDRLQEAERLLQRIMPTTKNASTPDSLIVSHVLMARLALARGERDTWLRYLVELEQIGHQAGSPRVQCSAWLERARVAILEHRLDAAQQALESAEQVGGWDRPGFLMFANDVDTPSIARQRLHIALGEHAAAVEALRPAIADARERLHRRREIKLQVLLALALDGLGRTQPAFEALGLALQLASQNGFVETFVEEGERLVALLRRWTLNQRTQGGDQRGVEPRFLAALLERLNIVVESAGSGEGSADAHQEALTAREIQVLQLLAAGHRNRAIAEKLFLSECTVKSHLRKINAKLGAQGRTQAIAIARNRGLLD
ncbi:LuxR C-terminal-related transcriptional regulator [Pseudomonas schmalbachii]|uniref:Helix-turn-helix transcriptional regulator n=1 Tax=Pseudomonas schmalbachii TaxID=2816993 RepID=A0ABS3TUP5_9PSED|nr:LuxR C-terminal-related transcriptional regulator [Pseudomonas schmalbachii]MBO3277399.1 helix-turn-helix transcriptional regulator [Pseudomonas schmalbachii]